MCSFAFTGVGSADMNEKGSNVIFQASNMLRTVTNTQWHTKSEMLADTCMVSDQFLCAYNRRAGLGYLGVLYALSVVYANRFIIELSL